MKPDPTAPAISPDLVNDALRALILHLGAVPVTPAAAPMRRVIASPKRIEDTVRLIQQCGLTPTGIAYRPDGTTVIEIGGDTESSPRKPRGWNIPKGPHKPRGIYVPR